MNLNSYLENYINKILNEGVVADKYNSAKYLDEPDKTLTRYCLNGKDKYLLKPIFNLALEKYPNDASLIVYRGLNFATEADYTNFINQIKDSSLSLDSITSWSSNKVTAEEFSKSQKCYNEFMNFGIALADDLMRKSGERIHGYRGVILQTEIPANFAVDLRKFKNAVEDELLLPPGNYVVTISETLTYKDILKSMDNDVAEFINVPDFDENRARLNYVFKNFAPEDLSDKVKHKLFNHLTNGNTEFQYKLDTRFNSKHLDVPCINIYATALLAPDLFPYCLATDVQKYIKKQKRGISNLLDDFKKLYKPGLEVYFETPFLLDYIKFNDLYDKYIDIMRDTLGKEYNNPERIAAINSINDPDERRKAISKEAERMRNILTAIQLKQYI